MRTFLLTISISTAVLCSCGQQVKEFHFADIGMSIKIPTHFVIQDSFPKRTYFDSIHNQIEDSAIINEMESLLMKGLLVVNYLNEKNTMSINIIQESPKSGDFEDYYAFSKTMQQLVASQQSNGYDSSSTIDEIGNVSLRKFLTSWMVGNHKSYGGFYLARVKKYFLFIKVDYIDKTVGDDFEKILLSSVFK